MQVINTKFTLTFLIKGIMLYIYNIKWLQAKTTSKKIKYTYPQINNYLLMYRVYEVIKLWLWPKLVAFSQLPSKKNCKSHRFYDKQLYKQRNIIQRYFLRLKHFRKVFTCYDKLDSIFYFHFYYLSLSLLFSIHFLCKHHLIFLSTVLYFYFV